MIRTLQSFPVHTLGRARTVYLRSQLSHLAVQCLRSDGADLLLPDALEPQKGILLKRSPDNRIRQALSKFQEALILKRRMVYRP